MKCLSLIINESTKNELIDVLRDLPEVNAYTIFHGEGRYRDDFRPFESARDEVMGYVPRIRIDLLLDDTEVSNVIKQIKKCSICDSRLGFFWVSTVDAMGDL